MACVLITGGAGFIGSHLAESCLMRGDEVHVVVREKTSLDRLENILPQVKLHKIDLGSREQVHEALAKSLPDIVFHLAANTRRKPEQDLSDVVSSISSDLGNLVTLVSCCCNLSKPPRSFVRSGTLAEYGSAPPPFHENLREQPINTYGAAMAAGTHYLQMMQPRLPFAAATARLALTYGAGQSETFMIPAMIRKCIEGSEVGINQPKDTRDLIYVEDVVDALQKLAECPEAAGQVVNVASGSTPNMKQVAQLIASITKANPDLIKYAKVHSSSGMPDFRTSVSKVEKLIGWSTKTSLEAGLNKTIKWAQENV
jgi:nucleoside-diphosphate-sugar epimerase